MNRNPQNQSNRYKDAPNYCSRPSWSVTYSRADDIRLQGQRTQRFAEGEFARSFQGFEKQAENPLSALHSAPSLQVLRDVRSNRLKKLSGNRTGQYSLRINEQWRFCFEWPDKQSGPGNVEIPDSVAHDIYRLILMLCWPARLPHHNRNLSELARHAPGQKKRPAARGVPPARKL